MFLQSLKTALCRFLSCINRIIPKSDTHISIYGRRMLNDNAEAILDHLITRHYNEKYTIHLLIHPSVWHEDYKGLLNVDICTHPLRTFWVLFRSKYVLHTQKMSICTMKPARGQIIFNLWHGSLLKATGKMIGLPMNPETDTYFLSTSPFWASINEKCFGHTQGQMFIGSNPRNDLLFDRIDANLLIPVNNGKKVVLFMPTFRNSAGLGRHDAEKDFPLLTPENMNSFDDFLSKKNLMLIIKPHPYQNKIDFLLNPYKNIKVIFNEDLKRLGIKLYGLLGWADALITDFSSVYFDYLLLDRPIGFAVDDMESYAANRGYTVKDPLSIMPGPKIKDVDGLKEFLCDVADGVDNYREDRYKINDLVNTYKTGDACQRIIDFVGIRK